MMNQAEASRLVQETFESRFEKEKFVRFIKYLFESIEIDNSSYSGNSIPDSIEKYEIVGKYENEKHHRIDILIVYLKKDTSIDRARSMQRNFVARYLKGEYGSKSQKDAALVAFVSPDRNDWRFSLVKLEYKLEAEKGKTTIQEELTPAKRWSFLVGKNEKSHTAQSRFVALLESKVAPNLKEIEDRFKY